MKHPVYLCLSAYSLISCCILQTETLCPHPDVPANGNYSPKQREFEPGDVVKYSCNQGFALEGKETRTCKLNGLWSDHSPFCDHATQLEDPSVDSKLGLPQLVSRVIDGNNKTCFEWSNPKGQYMYVHITKRIIIRTVKILLKGSTEFQILTGLNDNMTLNADHKSFLDTEQWVVIKLRNNVSVDTLKILIMENSTLSICEIEVYGRAEDECEHSPKRSIPNGHLEVSRSKAVLICDEGFRSDRDNRIVCEGNDTWLGGPLQCEDVLCNPFVSSGQPGVEWTFLDTSQKLSVGTRSKITCRTGYQMIGDPDTIFCQKNGKWTKTNATCVEKGDSKQKVQSIVIGGVAIGVVLLIIALLAVIIYFIQKQKKKEVVVFFQPQTDESVVSHWEIENDLQRHERMKNKAPEPPSTPRPMAKLSTMSRCGEPRR